MKTGDLVRVLRVPDSVSDSAEFRTRSTLERCVGRIFPIMGFNDVGVIEVQIGEILGKPRIWKASGSSLIALNP
jgi:hypothetical protein